MPLKKAGWEGSEAEAVVKEGVVPKTRKREITGAAAARKARARRRDAEERRQCFGDDCDVRDAGKRQ